jgi:hypothetical protein
MSDAPSDPRRGAALYRWRRRADAPPAPSAAPETDELGERRGGFYEWNQHILDVAGVLRAQSGTSLDPDGGARVLWHSAAPPQGALSRVLSDGGHVAVAPDRTIAIEDRTVVYARGLGVGPNGPLETITPRFRVPERRDHCCFPAIPIPLITSIATPPSRYFNDYAITLRFGEPVPVRRERRSAYDTDRREVDDGELAAHDGTATSAVIHLPDRDARDRLVRAFQVIVGRPIPF